MAITFIGAGNVASHLAIGLSNAGIKIDTIYSRTLNNAASLAETCSTIGIDQLADIPLNSDLYIICVPDDVIRELAISLKPIIPGDSAIVHTSGSRPTSDLDIFENRGVFYPLQTFTKGKDLDLSKVPFLIHGESPKMQTLLESLAAKLSTHIYPYGDNERAEVHVSAVMVNNFVNHILYLSETHLNKYGLDPKVLHPLIRETVEKALSTDTYQAQTGPARRHDLKTIIKHLERLSYKKRLQKIYKSISKSILRAYPQDK